MRVGRYIITGVVFAVACGLAPAALAVPRPSPHPSVVTRADYIAERLSHDPVFVSDDVPRDVTAEDARKIRAAVRRMPVPTYVAVIADLYSQDDPTRDPDRLIALLHDELGRPGVYVVVPSTGIGLEAEQFGTHLPVKSAADEIVYSQPYNAGAVRVIERFVDDIRSGHAQQRYETAYAKSRHGWKPAPYPEPGDAVDTAGEAGACSGLFVALLGAALIIWRRYRARSRGRVAR